VRRRCTDEVIRDHPHNIQYFQRLAIFDFCETLSLETSAGSSPWGKEEAFACPFPFLPHNLNIYGSSLSAIWDECPPT